MIEDDIEQVGRRLVAGHDADAVAGQLRNFVLELAVSSD